MPACEGVTYEILDLYRFLVTEVVFLDDFLLNYMSLICSVGPCVEIWAPVCTFW